MVSKYLKSILKSQISLEKGTWKGYFINPAKLRYQFIHCNLIDVDNPSRNFTTRKYTPKSMV